MMNIRHFLYTLIACLGAAVLSSCEHRILTDPTDVHYVRVYLDEDIRNVTYGFYNESYDHPEFTRPLNMMACLADSQSGEIISEGILKYQGSDERGNYIHGYIAAPLGEYNLLVYQLGSPHTLVKQTGNYFSMHAYTSTVGERVLGYLAQTSKVIDSEKIMQEPDHILVTRYDGIRLKHSVKVDTLRTDEGDFFTARSIAKSYYLQLNIKGVQWVKSASAVLSGLSGSSLLCEEEGMVESDPVHLYFNMQYNGSQKRASSENPAEVLHATFTTFGKIPDLTSELTLNFEFTKSDGSSQVESIDITEVFKTQLAIENQWLLLDKEISITKPIGGSGGMDPGVDGWKEEEADLPM